MIHCFYNVRLDYFNCSFDLVLRMSMILAGLKKIAAANGVDIQIVLQVSHVANDIPMSLLSDTDFTQVTN